jgi:hypothetical protein
VTYRVCEPRNSWTDCADEAVAGTPEIAWVWQELLRHLTPTPWIRSGDQEPYRSIGESGP